MGRLQTPVREAFSCEICMTFFFHCDSMKHKLIHHWITIKYVVSRIIIPRVRESATYLFPPASSRMGLRNREVADSRTACILHTGYGMFSLLFNEVTHTSGNHNENMPYPVWQCMPYGSPQPPYCLYHVRTDEVPAFQRAGSSMFCFFPKPHRLVRNSVDLF